VRASGGRMIVAQYLLATDDPQVIGC